MIEEIFSKIIFDCSDAKVLYMLSSTLPIMGTITISVPKELEKAMKEFKLDWSDVAMRAILDKTEKLKRLKEISSKVKISDRATKEFTDKISELVAKRFRDAG